MHLFSLQRHRKRYIIINHAENNIFGKFVHVQPNGVWLQKKMLSAARSTTNF